MTELIGSIVFFSVLGGFAVIALGKFGISITPFVAALGAFALGAGLAMQGIVSNYGASLSIRLHAGVRRRQHLDRAGVSGVVEQIRLPYTILVTEDGEQLMIPNREIIGQILENSFAVRLVETRILLHRATDPLNSIDVLAAELGGLDELASEPSAQIGIDELTENGVRLSIRCWVPTRQYFQAKFRVNAHIYRTLQSAPIELGTPLQDVRLLAAS
jgi:small conductance mechanosensitive channel